MLKIDKIIYTYNIFLLVVSCIYIGFKVTNNIKTKVQDLIVCIQPTRPYDLFYHFSTN